MNARGRFVAAIASAVVLVAVIGFSSMSAGATQGQPLTAGILNTETAATWIENTSTSAVTPIALQVQQDGYTPGAYGIRSFGTTGIFAHGTTAGLYAEANGAGDGVDGAVSNSCCSGVYGLNSGSGNGVAGRADTGTGVLAASTGGIALKTDGKTQFSRSGIALVQGTAATPTNSVQISYPGLTNKSMVFATLQNRVAGVFVAAAVPNAGSGYFTIYLNKNVSKTVGPIAWIVTERP